MIVSYEFNLDFGDRRQVGGAILLRRELADGTEYHSITAVQLDDKPAGGVFSQRMEVQWRCMHRDLSEILEGCNFAEPADQKISGMLR